jgi:hypothetical protein
MVDVSSKCIIKLYLIYLLKFLSQHVMRGFATKNYVDRHKIEKDLVPALQNNYSLNVQPIPLEMKQGRFL